MNIVKKILATGFSAALMLGVTGCWYKPINITGVDVKPDEVKVGTSKCVYIFFFPIGKCTMGEAVKNGGLTQVQTADIKYFNILFYGSKTVEVRGK